MKKDGDGNLICSLEMLHQGNSRQRSSCKDDIDHFKIPLFPIPDIRLLQLLEISLPGESSICLITTTLNAAQVVAVLLVFLHHVRL